MRVYLVHHADAVGPDVDPQRPLSSLGRTQAADLADRVKAAGFKPASIWHSGKLRARQTAEFCLQACNPFAEFRMVRGLRPDDSPELMRDELAADTRDLMLVGHMPHLDALARMLAQSPIEFPLHGAIALERTAEGWAVRSVLA